MGVIFPPSLSSPAGGEEITGDSISEAAGKARGGEGRLSSLTQARRRLRRLGLRPRKGLGQHFLVDSGALRHILQAAELLPTDTVIEVGPGLGILTRELASRAGRVIAVELDESLATALGQELAGFPQAQVISADILSLDVAQFLLSRTGLPAAALDFQYKVVANLPYYIASAVLRHFLEASLKPKLLVLMVQKEVAQAMVARPGRMSLLSVSVQFYGQARMVARVKPQSFYPPPKVHSAIVRIDPSATTPVAVAYAASFFRLVKAGFSAPRKQLHNALAQGLGIGSGEAVIYLEQAGLDPQRRAQTLSLAEWAGLWQSFSQRSPVRLVRSADSVSSFGADSLAPGRGRRPSRRGRWPMGAYRSAPGRGEPDEGTRSDID